MSNYRLTDEQRQLKEAARRFAEEKLRPIALETERQSAPMPRETLKLLAEHGYVGLDIPTEYGGLGLNIMECAIVLEELSSVWFSASTNAMTLLTGPLLAFGTEEQKQKYLPAIVSAETMAGRYFCFCSSVPNARSGPVNKVIALVDAENQTDESSSRTMAHSIMLRPSPPYSVGISSPT